MCIWCDGRQMNVYVYQILRHFNLIVARLIHIPQIGAKLALLDAQQGEYSARHNTLRFLVGSMSTQWMRFEVMQNIQTQCEAFHDRRARVGGTAANALYHTRPRSGRVYHFVYVCLDFANLRGFRCARLSFCVVFWVFLCLRSPSPRENTRFCVLEAYFV